MALRIPLVVSLTLIAAVIFSPSAQAQMPAGSAARGHDLAYTCQGCHAIPNYKNVYPTYSVPMVHGQRPEYLYSALKSYKSGDRSHGTMHAQASSLSDQDMADIAVYFGGPAVLTKSANDVPADKRPKATETCLACHGTNGVGITADFPTLSGQHKDYIERALHDYQKGGRKNPVMGGMVTSLTPAEIEEVAEYYSGQTPALETLPKKRFFFSTSTAPAK